jgi:hypothetical protein
MRFWLTTPSRGSGGGRIQAFPSPHRQQHKPGEAAPLSYVLAAAACVIRRRSPTALAIGSMTRACSRLPELPSSTSVFTFRASTVYSLDSFSNLVHSSLTFVGCGRLGKCRRHPNQMAERKRLFSRQVSPEAPGAGMLTWLTDRFSDRQKGCREFAGLSRGSPRLLSAESGCRG